MIHYAGNDIEFPGDMGKAEIIHVINDSVKEQKRSTADLESAQDKLRGGGTLSSLSDNELKAIHHHRLGQSRICPEKALQKNDQIDVIVERTLAARPRLSEVFIYFSISAFGPPLALLVIGGVVAWVLRGFRPAD